jgi:RimJ/RimL family protein N-acetyltransferase
MLKKVSGQPRLVCLVVPGNTASVGVAEKVGMSFEREFTDEFGPCHLYALALPGGVVTPRFRRALSRSLSPRRTQP